MEPVGDVNPMDKVLQDIEIVESILQRVGSSLAMVRARAVCPTWNAATRTASFIRSFVENTKPANVGFIVEFAEGEGKLTRLVYPLPSDGHETTDMMREKVDADLLEGDDVLATDEGIVLTAGPEGGGYHTSFLWSIPRMYKPVAPLMPEIPFGGMQHTTNTMGQFGILPDVGESGISFFSPDHGGVFIPRYDGVSFDSTADIYVHVNVYNGVEWVRHVSGPIASPQAALFQRSPYSVLDGNVLYMMYLVGYIIAFDMVSLDFYGIAFPPEIVRKVRSCHDYTVAPRTGGGLALVHFNEGFIDKWVLDYSEDGEVWSMERRVHVVMAFGRQFDSRFSFWSWTRVIFRDLVPVNDTTFTVQVRKASKDAGFVFLTLGFDPSAMYEIDMWNGSAREINSGEREGVIEAVFHVAEPWPPAN